MYPVSAAYLTAKNKIPQVHSFKLSGMIGETAFTEMNILKGSLSIANKCSNGNDIVIGSVVIGTLKATFIGIDDIPENSDITLSEGLKLADGTYEYVPMGVYRVAEATITKSGIVVTAYDRMSFFDKDVISLDTTYGNPYSIATLACTECGMVLVNTSAEMESLPNGNEQLYLSTNNDIQTWQDIIFWLAQAMACFATIDRQGRLVFRTFGQIANDSIDNHKRYTGASFSKFVVRYSSINVTNSDDGTTSYYGLEEDNYLTYNLGANPFLQHGTEFERERIRKAVLNGIANIAYTPFKAKVNVGALYDLGDIIQNTEGLADGSSVSCIMRYLWKYNGGYEMEGVGKNPALSNARSKMDKAIQGMISSINDDTIQYYLFTNAEGVTVEDGDTKKIIDIRFASKKSTVAIFQAEIMCDVETTANANMYDAVCTVKYRYNDVYLDSYQPKETWVDGYHILHLLYFFNIQSAQEARLEVLINMRGGRVVIPMNGIRSSVYGQALAASDRWDGTIDIRQEIERIDLDHPGGITARNVITAVSVDTQTPIPNGCTQEIPVITLEKPTHGLLMRGVSDGLLVDFTEV